MSEKSVDPVDIKIPDLGDFDSIEVIEILVKEGDVVENEMSLITLETDKATMDIPSPRDGKITTLNIKIGDKVKEGDLIGRMMASTIPEKEIDNPEIKPQKSDKNTKIVEKQPSLKQVDTYAEKPAPLAIVNTKKLPNINEKSFSLAHASPSVRRFARELGVNLIEVRGNGPKSRILQTSLEILFSLNGFHTKGLKCRSKTTPNIIFFLEGAKTRKSCSRQHADLIVEV